MPPFFTNGVNAGASLTGSEKFPADVGNDSKSFTALLLGRYVVGQVDLPNAAYSSDSSTTSFSPTGAAVSGAKFVALELNGALGADATLTMPGATDMAAALLAPTPNQSFVLRILNTSSAAHKWTVGNSSDGTVTVSGTADVLQNEWQDFVVNFNAALTVATLQNVGGGTA